MTYSEVGRVRDLPLQLREFRWSPWFYFDHGIMEGLRLGARRPLTRAAHHVAQSTPPVMANKLFDTELVRQSLR